MKISWDQTKIKLFSELDYQFQDETLFQLALTHRSAGGAVHNERLEFLGDSIVNCVIAEQLFHQFSNANEGELSRLRASLVNREALALLAQQFKLGAYLLLGMGEERSGGRTRQSILSCAMEAMIGAIYLDGGFSAVRQCILKWYHVQLSSLSLTLSHKDPKTCLQEKLQAVAAELPYYEVIAAEGEAHNQTFTVACTVHHFKMTTQAIGKSRKRAEQAAAELMLNELKKIEQTQGKKVRHLKRHRPQSSSNGESL